MERPDLSAVEQATRSAPLLMVTSDDVPGRQIVDVKGLVRGHSVMVRGIHRDIQAVFRTVVGGRVGVYSELLTSAREAAIQEMMAEAEQLGASALVAVRLSTSQVMGGASEVLAYGTAVVVE